MTTRAPTAPILSVLALSLAACDPELSSTGGTVVEVTQASDPSARFTLTDPVFTDEDGDGDWSPGESATILVMLNETSGEDFMAYPGVLFEADGADVAVHTPEFWFYGILGGDSMEAYTALALSEDAVPGDRVALTMRVSSLVCDGGSGWEEECPDPNPLALEISVW